MDIKQELTDLADEYEREGEHDHVVKVCRDALAEIERLEAQQMKLVHLRIPGDDGMPFSETYGALGQRTSRIERWIQTFIASNR